MAFTINARARHWIQITALLVLGALAAASAAWGQVVESAVDPELDRAPAAPQERQSIDWPEKPIADIQIDPRDMAERKPPDKSVDLVGNASPEHWFSAQYAPVAATWVAPNIYYQPLYFEDVPLERYGQQHWGHPMDLARTGILFYGGVLALPYNLLKESPHSCDTPLGFARPGSPAPCTYNYLLYRN